MTLTVPTFAVGQQLVLTTGAVVTIVGVQPAPIPSVYVQGETGNVWQDSPRGMASRIVRQ